MYYRSEGKSVCADVIPYYENGKFYLFYLKDFRDVVLHGEGCPWCLLTTEDFVHYEDHGEVLVRGGMEAQDLYVFTGSCCKFGDTYYIFYTGHNPHKRAKGLPEEKILLAKSTDLYHWDKVSDFSIQAPEGLEIHDFRDPFVYYDEVSNRYCMLLAGRLNNDAPTMTKGVTLILYSDNLLHWTISERPFYSPSAYYTHECPDLFKMGDWWYLVFSEFSDKVVTTYRMSKSPEGPWITPKVNTFDGHAFYAAKTVSDGKRRFLLGWNCIKNEEKDESLWQWGGTIIPHEIVQEKDGTLYVKCPEEVEQSYFVQIPIGAGRFVGRVEKTINGYIVGENSGRSIKMLGKMPQCCKLEMTFITEDEIGDFGVLLRADEKVDHYYAVKLEPKYNRLAFDKCPRRDNTIHTQVDVERYCPLMPGEKNRLVIIVENSVAEVYVNDRIAMSVRMFDHKCGDFGLYTHNMQVKFEDIKMAIIKK